tara:strand:- start:540 stop:785 length:246 start_codon:yes stop_codon:yes gene_type:complete
MCWRAGSFQSSADFVDVVIGTKEGDKRAKAKTADANYPHPKRNIFLTVNSKCKNRRNAYADTENDNSNKDEPSFHDSDILD